MRNLTVTNPDLETAERKTIEGMAFWSGSGPKQMGVVMEGWM